MIVGVGRTPPDIFFDELRLRDIELDYNVTAICSSLANLTHFCRTHHHIVFFNIPETLVRINPVYMFDVRTNIDDNGDVEFVPHNPLWSTLNMLRFRTNPPPTRAIISNKPDVVGAMIEAERKNDVLDKINMLTSITPKSSRRKTIERTLFNCFLNHVDADEVRGQLIKAVSHHRKPDSTEILAIEEIVKWYTLPIREQLIKGLETLLREPDSWKQNVGLVSAQFGVRSFELGYIMSFLERNQK